MSLKLMDLAFYVKGLTPPQKSVLVALADHAHDDGSSVYPSVARLVLKTSFAERTIRRALADLQQKELIHEVKPAVYHFPTEFRLNVALMKSLQEKPKEVLKKHLSGLADLPDRQVSPETDLPERQEGVPESPEDLPERQRRPARAAPKPSFNHKLNRQEVEAARLRIPASPKEAIDHLLIKPFFEISGVYPAKSDYRCVIDASALLLEQAEWSVEALVQKGMLFWIAWQSRKTKNGGSYDPTNPAWFTEWMVNDYIPRQRDGPKSKYDRSMDIIKRFAESDDGE